MLTTRSLTILFTDIVGYTARTAAQSRAEQIALLQQHDNILYPLIRQYGGNLIKSMGDGVLVTFRSSTMALRCAMAMQDALAASNVDCSEMEQLHIRVALASGDVQLQKQDVFGEAVSIAARIEALTPADQIYFSASVYLGMNKAEISAEQVATENLKGIAAPVDIYRVLPRGEHGRFHEDAQGQAQDREAADGWHGIPAARWVVSVLMVGVLIAGLAWLGVRSPSESVGDKVESPVLPGRAEAPVAEAGVQDIESLLAAGKVDQAQQALGQVLAANDASAPILLAQGHVAFANKRRESGIDAYRKALVITPALAGNPLLAKNLVGALGWESQSARGLLEQYASPAMIEALSARTAQAGYWGRWHASATLAAIGQTSQIKAFDAALLDLQEAEDCAKRSEAIARLGKQKDRRALLVLEPLAEMPLLTRLTSDDACLVEPAKAAVANFKPE